MQKTFLVSVILMLTAGFAAADMYKWVDDKGTINFTEDYSKIPKKYRKKVKVKREDVGGAPESVSAAGESPKKELSVKSAGDNGANVKEEKKKVVYGGRSEDEWKNDFRKLIDRIDNVQAQIDERKGRLNDPDSLSRARYRGIELETKDLEEKLAQLRGNLEALDASATKAGVPYEIRK